MVCAIRPWRLSDAEALTKVMNNKNVLSNLRDGIPYPYTVENALVYLEMKQNEETGKSYAFAITLDDIAIGTLGLTRKDNIHSRTAELGYALGEEYWGKGYATYAVWLACKYIFENTDIIRIFAEPYAYNTASCRVLEKAGFALEGIMRKNAVKDGKVLDMKLYAIVKEEI